jgi:hypothetical protein
MNLSIISCTNYRYPLGRRRGGLGTRLYTLLSSPSSVLSLLLSCGSNSHNPCCTTMNCATLIMADNIGGYCLAPFQSSSSTPSTANAHTNRLSYSLRVMRWSSNAMQNFKHAFYILDKASALLPSAQPALALPCSSPASTSSMSSSSYPSISICSSSISSSVSSTSSASSSAAAPPASRTNDS